MLPLMNAMAIVALLYIDYVQSTVMGSMVGLVIPTFASSIVDSFLYAPAVFLFLKFGCYSLGVLVGINLIDTLYLQAGWQGGAADLSMTVLRVVIMVAVQEILIRGLWRLILIRMNSRPEDAEAALNPN